MKKYLHVISIGIQNNLTYRFNYLTRTLFSFIPLFAMLSLLRTIYSQPGSASTLSDYTQAQIIFYYMLVATVDVLPAVDDEDSPDGHRIPSCKIRHLPFILLNFLL